MQRGRDMRSRKGTPVARRGRKARGLSEIAQPPKELDLRCRNSSRLPLPSDVPCRFKAASACSQSLLGRSPCSRPSRCSSAALRPPSPVRIAPRLPSPVRTAPPYARSNARLQPSALVQLTQPSVASSARHAPTRTRAAPRRKAHPHPAMVAKAPPRSKAANRPGHPRAARPAQAQVRPAQVQLAQVRPAQVRPAQVQLAQVRPDRDPPRRHPKAGRKSAALIRRIPR
jgi:hypothetical protein